MENMIENPLLKGFYPDPSICRAGDDYYMVTSSFSFFPGIPVFHSKDLKHWEQVGHVIDRPEQMTFSCRDISGGLYAPTIRFHEGIFYVICTNVTNIGDFVCTAKDPAGAWSEPHIIKGARGIDPSLFWDEDGTCYMCGNAGIDKPGQDFGIWCARFDTEKFAIDEPHWLWAGALIAAHAPEAPHIYKKNGWYYLMIAEGGTEEYHAVTIARSRDIFGPYTGFRGNPILTHRHLGLDYPIANTGHGDLFETQKGEWYMVLLASRLCAGHKVLGRETFIVPVDFSGEWPVVNKGVGKVEFLCPDAGLPECPYDEPDGNDFHALCWNCLGTPDNQPVRILDAHTLTIRCIDTPVLPCRGENPDYAAHALGFYGRRQQHMSFDAGVKVAPPMDERAVCGLGVMQSNHSWLRVELVKKKDGMLARLIRSRVPEENAAHRYDWQEIRCDVLAEKEFEGEEALLSIHDEMNDYAFFVNGMPLGHADGGFLGSDISMGFIGAYVALFASGNGQDTGLEAKFTDFSYRGI